jgi:hypothetical protein
VIDEAIRRYLVAHPSACDTVEGVARWWLAAEDAPASYAAVAAALDRLAAVGVVERRILANGRTVYSAGGGRAPPHPP